MATAALRSTSAEANFQSIARLVIIGGRALLREIFDIRCSASCLPKMLQNPVTVKRLREAHLTESQWDCLYPAPGVYGKSANFDISLLYKLLSTICSITPPATGWNARPANTDLSLAADLTRVKYYRDFVYGHVNQSVMKMTDDEYFSLCEEISDSLLRIAQQISTEKRGEWHKIIRNFLKDPLVVEEGKNVQELLRRYENDTEVMKELIPELTTSTQDLSVQTIFQEKAGRIKDLLREELRSKTKEVQQVENPSSKRIKGSLKGTSHVPGVAVREKFQIKDQTGEVHQSGENLTSSASGSRVAGGQLKRLFFLKGYVILDVTTWPDVSYEVSKHLGTRLLSNKLFRTVFPEKWSSVVFREHCYVLSISDLRLCFVN